MDRVWVRAEAPEELAVRKIVFLDMDGVVTHFKSDYRIDPACVSRLNDLLARTGAEVVISSSWRLMYSYESIARRLKRIGFKGRVVGQTPALPGSSRGEEIQAYLEETGGRARFVILDDVDDLEPLSSRLVLTDELVGLQDRDVDRAVVMMDGESA
jgi:hypothetical protein